MASIVSNRSLGRQGTEEFDPVAIRVESLLKKYFNYPYRFSFNNQWMSNICFEPIFQPFFLINPEGWVDKSAT